MSTAIQPITDIAPRPEFSMSNYMRTLDDAAITEQQLLAGAYDRACASLIGPNDVQQEGGRTFKKKSAWRKLARYFNITVTADLADARIDMLPTGEWVAVARASAIAPWGQRFDDLGACGSDEETGRRTITYADAVATALTRAANRAVSNLIAMGEVSAEEMTRRGANGGNGHTQPHAAPAPNVQNGSVIPDCPKCGGPMWDNRETKTNPRAPDFKCRDKQGCDGAIWPPKEAAKAGNPTGSTRSRPKSAPSSDEPPPPDDLPF